MLVVLAGVEPPWTLSGGAALVGFHTNTGRLAISTASSSSSVPWAMFVDLVADPVPLAEPPQPLQIGTATIDRSYGTWLMSALYWSLGSICVEHSPIVRGKTPAFRR